MNVKTVGAICVMTLLGTGGANAALIHIDDFNDAVIQRVSDVPGVGLTNADSKAYTNAIGGTRDLQVTNNEGLVDGTELRVQNGILSFSNISLATGSGVITYDGDSDPTTLDPFGLGGVDLQQNSVLGKNFFIFDLVSADADIDISIDVYDMSGGFSTFSQPISFPFDPILPFSAFTGNADFNDVGALVFTAASINIDLDGSIDSIKVGAVPLPASALLLFGGVGALSAIRRGKRASA